MQAADILSYAVPVAMVVALVAGVRFLVKRVGLTCQFCANTRCDRFSELPAETQRQILRYFRECEHREPETDAVFVCRECRTVYDDFSGEKDSLSPDRVVYKAGGVTRTVTTGTAFCKACNTILLFCDPVNPDVRCSHCGTSHAWRADESSGYRFLMPAPGTRVLARCHDPTPGTA